MTANKYVISVLMAIAVASSSCFKRRATRYERKLLIDTDAGVDDAIAIIMATEIEKYENGPKIVGITCVNGNANVDDVSVNVLKTLKAVNRLDIPVYKGASHPLLLANKKDNYFGNDGFGDFDYPDPPSTNLIRQKHAVNAMIELVKEYPREITLVAIGPLTNVALAIRMYPPFLNKLRSLVIMGGSTEGIGNVKPHIEFNFYADPVADYIVFNSTKSPVTLVPWETVRRTGVTTKFRKSLSESNNEKVWLIDSAERLSFDPKAEYWYCADAVAMTVALTSGSVVTRSGIYYSDAIYDGMLTAGMIVVDYTNITRKNPNTYLVQSIDDKVYKDFLSIGFNS